jgi:transposase
VSELGISAKQRRALESIVARPTAAAGLVRRVRVVLLSADDLAGREIATRLDLSEETVSRIRRRFIDGGVEGLSDRPKAGRKDHAVPSAVVEEIVQLSMSPPPPGRARWTTRLLADRVGITSGTVSDILRKQELKPHLVRTYKVSRDPQFAAKVKDVVGLYLHPPKHAIVLSVDEKTSIQALERTQVPLRYAKAGRFVTRKTTSVMVSSISLAPSKLQPARSLIS